MAKYLKLGPKATNFYDPFSGVKVTPGVVVKVEKAQTKSSKVDVAIKHRHLVEASEEEYKAFLEGSPETFEDEDTLFDPNKASKAELIKEILEYEGTDHTEASLSKLNKAELLEVYEELTEEDEDEDN